MQLEKKIIRAVKHIAAIDMNDTLSQNDIEVIAQRVISDVNGSNYDFSKADYLVLSQNGKKRLVKRFVDQYSTENVLCQCIKAILDNDFSVKYPNRNKMIRTLVGTLSAVTKMADFTIIRFDFKDFFNSISTEYFYNKYILENISDRDALGIIKDFCEETQYAYAGLSTSNSIAEIIASSFDELVTQNFLTEGLIYYERYIDDGVIILNCHMHQQDVCEILDKIRIMVFFDENVRTRRKCKTNFNSSKFKYISRRNLAISAASFDFLGYEFFLSQNNNSVTIKTGITIEKQKKYRERLDNMISMYLDPTCLDYKNEELLRHRVAAFTSREVYMSVRYRQDVWKVKGFISNYGELRTVLGTKMIHPDTEYFLKNMVIDAFNSAGILPYFIKGSPNTKPGYCLYENMRVNKTILLVDGIGYDYEALVKLCGKVGISNLDASGKKRRYGSLVHDYLIKTNVGY